MNGRLSPREPGAQEIGFLITSTEKEGSLC